MREYGQISAKTLGEMRKKRTTAHNRKLQVASSAPLLLHATFQGERCARYARRTQKKYSNPLCASPAPLLLHATFQGERYARYARRTQKILKIRYAPLHSKRKQAQNYTYSEDN